MSGIKQSQARGLKINDPARRAQTTFIALPLVFALFLSSGFAQESPKHPEEDPSLSSGWASSKFNDIYIGLSKWSLNFIGAEGSLSYYCRPYLYFRPHFKFSNIADRRLREYLDSPTINRFGLAMGVEF